MGAELIPAFDGETTRHTLTILPGTSEIDLTLIAYNPDPATTIALVEQGESTDLFAGMGSGDSVSVDVTEPPPVLIITVSEPGLEEPSVYRVEVTALPLCTLSLSMSIPDDGDGVRQVIDVDKDNDGLIEICDLEGLDAMRYVLNGSGYKTTDSTMVEAIDTGCPNSGCNGYELTKSLDFMADDSYRDTANKATWTVANYDDSSDTGWQPIGRGFPDVFAARFDGNGYTISNLMINRSGSDDIGLFGETTSSRIANLGLLDVDIIGQDFVGGLVGENFSRITNSYVTGEVRGSSVVGGLVGKNEGNLITNSYATASVTGTGNNVGGLVGRNVGTAFIMNSYATGRVEGSDSSSNVGGLVGMNESLGSITNSYATGEVTGSGATVGGLVGNNIDTSNNTGTITSSYWLSRPGLSRGMGDTTSTPTAAIVLTSPTSPTDIYMGWDANAWDFGSPFEYPALKYATDCVNRDENTVKPVAGQPTCDTLLGDDQKVELELPIPSCTLSLIDIYPDDDDGVPQFMDVDKDNNGLIEICDLEGLDEIRYQLDGRGYRTGADADVIDDGCATTCTGFELTKNLDFNDPTSYRPDSTNQTAWTSEAGWNPIGTLTATFDGNGHTISNLMINRSGTDNVGLFGRIGTSAEIANLGLLNVNVKGNSRVGGLVGNNNAGTITNSYVKGIVSGSRRNLGGLVGQNDAGRIENSYAMVSVSSVFTVGGLIGVSFRGNITNSYATGSVSGTSFIGGLMGSNSGGQQLCDWFCFRDLGRRFNR